MPIPEAKKELEERADTISPIAHIEEIKKENIESLQTPSESQPGNKEEKKMESFPTHKTNQENKEEKTEEIKEEIKEVKKEKKKEITIPFPEAKQENKVVENFPNHKTNQEIKEEKTEEIKEEIKEAIKEEEKEKIENTLPSPEAKQEDKEEKKIALPAQPEPNQEDKIKKDNEPAVREQNNSIRYLRPLKISDEEIEGFLENYLAKIQPEIKESYPSLQDILKRSRNSSEAYYMLHTSLENTKTEHELIKDGIEGIAIFCKENPFDNKRVTILHASTVDPKKMSAFLGNLIDYIWKMVFCMEIRVELTYIRQGNNYEPLPELKNTFCQDNNFKWKTLLNNSTIETGKRVVALGCSKPTTAEFLNPR